MIRPTSRKGQQIDVVITGGGTAGHIHPALAVAEALVSVGYVRKRICFVGSRRGMESQLVPDAGFRVKLFPGRGIVRKIDLGNLVAIGALISAFVGTFFYLVWYRPKVIATVGGYAGVACAFAGLCLGIPIVVINIDAIPGASNRLIGRFARLSCVARSPSGLRHEVLTGAPIRPEVLSVARTSDGIAKLKQKYGLEQSRQVLLVMGGSLGARRLNEAGLALAEAYAARTDLVHRCEKKQKNIHKV